MKTNDLGKKGDLESIENDKSDSNEVYLNRYRDELIISAQDQITTFDKSVLALSSASIGISVIFLGGASISLNTTAKLFLAFGWTFLLGAIVSNLCSYLTSYNEQISNIEKVDKIFERNAFSEPLEFDGKKNFTRTLNYISLIFFVLGTCFLAFFSLSAIGGT